MRMLKLKRFIDKSNVDPQQYINLVCKVLGENHKTYKQALFVINQLYPTISQEMKRLNNFRDSHELSPASDTNSFEQLKVVNLMCMSYGPDARIREYRPDLGSYYPLQNSPHSHKDKQTIFKEIKRCLEENS